MRDSFGVRRGLKLLGVEHEIYNLEELARQRPAMRKLPFSLKILLENLLRHEDGRVVRKEEIEELLDYKPQRPSFEIAFHPGRVLLQDFTGVPVIADLAAMRDAVERMGGDPQRVNPVQPVDLVIDHSVQVDHFGSAEAFTLNAQLELTRNRERYAFLRWGQQAFAHLRVVPPDTGIVHQVNLEYLAQVAVSCDGVVSPDTLVGTDSHTTMVNGLGVLGWGVGGIEAEAAMLGQPVSMLIPQVVGVELTKALPAGATATDLVLTITEMLRKHGVVGAFVEFCGPGARALPLADRATVANMAPEYGATIGFFPTDAETLAYLRLTHRSADQIALVEAYCRRQGLLRAPDSPEPLYSDRLSLDLSTVVPSVAGPRRPQDRVSLKQAKQRATATLGEAGRAARPRNSALNGCPELKDGAVVIAAITSCTNTSNPAVMLGAGLLAQKAAARGLARKPWVKSSLAPGSKVVTEYLVRAGLMPALEQLGFHLVGYGCTTCIGNSGPLEPAVEAAITQGNLTVASVLSGNRNFEGRIHPLTRLSYLASPPLVVAYALAGTILIDFEREPLGEDKEGQPVFLRDLWPQEQELARAMAHVSADSYEAQYRSVFQGDERWQAMQVPDGSSYAWDPSSTYVRRPPFLDGFGIEAMPLTDILGARALAVLGDSVTTNHISPAGAISNEAPAGRYLVEHGVATSDFNSYGARRGNHEVMVRGTFANSRLRNELSPELEGGFTVHLPSGQRLPMYEAAMRYQAEGTPLVVLAGAEYGAGSSRDWAAKGTKLLGVRAVIAKSFERIHRSNLLGMGVLPLQLDPSADRRTLGLSGWESFDVLGLQEGLSVGKRLTLRARRERGNEIEIGVTTRIDTPNELDYYRHGGILPYVLRQLLR